MKRFVIALALLGASVGSRLYAQTADMKANIPFDFLVGANPMPAGDYTIHQSGGLISLNRAGGPGIFTLTLHTSRQSAPSTGVLEFHKYDDTYFLSSVWTARSTAGHALTTDSKEKELARRLGIGSVQTAALKTK